MATFAVMNGTTVNNIIVTDNQAQAESDLGVTLIEYTSSNPAGIGWEYDPTSGTFADPNAVIPPVEVAP